MINTALTPIELDKNAAPVAIVPARALSWHQVQLPNGTLSSGWMQERSAPRLRKILEGLLEDQLLDDPAKLHFSLQPGATDGKAIWVAACDKEWLQNALKTLRKNRHRPAKLAPEWSPYALGEDPSDQKKRPKIWVTGNTEAAYLTWIDEGGVHTLPVDAAHTHHTQLPAFALPDYELMAEPAVSHLAEQIFQQPARVIAPERRLRHAAQGDWNLAQFEFAWRNPFFIRLAKRWGIFWESSEWRPARWAILAVLLVHLIGLNALAWRYQQQLKQQQSAIRDVLVSTFPKLSVIVDPPIQMERELSQLRQVSGSLSPRDLEALLSAYGSAGQGVIAQGAPTSIEFTPGELRIGGMPVTEPLDGLINSELRARGFVSRMDGNTLIVTPQGKP
jgi:general secretion pathway protein L